MTLMARHSSADQADHVLTDLLNAASTFVEWLSTLGTGAVLLFTFLSSAVEMTFLLGLLVPGESVVMLAGSLPAGPAGFALVVAVGTAGGLTGQIIGYAVGRVLGDRLRSTRLGRRIGPERFDRAAAYLREHGAPALVAVRFVAVIHAVVPIVAGTARMPFGRFLGWSAVGTTLWMSAFAGVGAATAGADSTGGLGLMLTAVGATCLGAVPLGAKLLGRAFVTREDRVRTAGRERVGQAQHLVVAVPADTGGAGGQAHLLHVQRRVQRASEQRPGGQFGGTHEVNADRVFPAQGSSRAPRMCSASG